MSTLNAPTVGEVVTPVPQSVYPAVMQATIRTADGRHSLTALIGQAQPTMTDGRGGWTEVARPRRPSAVEWLGPNAHKATLEILLDAYASGGTVEAELAVVEALAPSASTVETPPVYVTGAYPIPATVPWVIQTAVPTGVLKRGDGRVARVTVTFELLQWRAGDVVVRNSPAKAATAAATTNKSSSVKPRKVTVKRGDTLGALAAKYLGSASKWQAIATANKLRDPNHLKVGQVLTIP